MRAFLKIFSLLLISSCQCTQYSNFSRFFARNFCRSNVAFVNCLGRDTIPTSFHRQRLGITGDQDCGELNGERVCVIDVLGNVKPCTCTPECGCPEPIEVNHCRTKQNQECVPKGTIPYTTMKLNGGKRCNLNEEKTKNICALDNENNFGECECTEDCKCDPVPETTVEVNRPVACYSNNGNLCLTEKTSGMVKSSMDLYREWNLVKGGTCHIVTGADRSCIIGFTRTGDNSHMTNVEPCTCHPECGCEEGAEIIPNPNPVRYEPECKSNSGKTCKHYNEIAYFEWVYSDFSPESNGDGACFSYHGKRKCIYSTLFDNWLDDECTCSDTCRC